MTYLSELHDGHKDLSENPEQRCYVLFYSWASQEAAAALGRGPNAEMSEQTRTRRGSERFRRRMKSADSEKTSRGG